MLRNFTLQPDEDKRLQVEGRYLVVTQATGPIELSIGGTLPIIVDEKDRIHMRDDSPNNRAIRIRNISGGVNNIELHTSDLLVDKRTSIQVENSIAIDADQIVGIDPSANIVQAIVQNPIRIDPSDNVVQMAEDQSIGIDPDFNEVEAIVQNAVRIDPNENTVKIEDGQRIGIDPDLNDVDVTIQNAVRIDPNENTVQFANDQVIGIDQNQNTVRLDDSVTLSIDPNVKSPLRFQMMDTITITDSNVNPIEEKPERVQLILTAAQSNSAPIWISDIPERGVPIWAGERVVLTTEQRLTLVGNVGDTCYVAEIVIN